MVSHADGTILVYDVERADSNSFTPDDPNTSQSHTALMGNDDLEKLDNKEWDPMESLFATLPPGHPGAANLLATGKSEKDKNLKNPVTHWRVSKGSILGIHFSSWPSFSPLIRR